ncbi:Arm DNA-binding domain-containing protein [Flavobacterium sp. DGU11]|uniref:Arm DNA-binding domain-containing protein n=1 Tax=Flavobacterium arundinis TaxID=3139143 RepID=A0ABU9HV74_9FLAO
MAIFLTFITAKRSLLKPLTIRKHFESVLNVMFNLNHIWYEEHKHFGIQFIIRVPKNEKTAEATVYARITVNGRRSEVSLKKKIDPKFWDEAKGRAKGKRDESASLNNYIERIRSIIADGYHNLIQERKPINVDSLKRCLLVRMKMP